MTGKRHKKPKSCSSKKADRAKSHVAKPTDLTSAAKSPQVDTLQSDENGGISEVWPSLAIENVDIGFDDEDPRESSDTGKPSRLRAPSKTVNEEEVRVEKAEKALQAKHQRSGHLGELRKRRNCVQDLITSPSVQEAELESALTRYEEAFHKFVSSHDNYLRFEDDEEKRELMIDSYENQRDMKLQLETLVCEWRANRRRVSPPSEAGFSLKSDKSEKSNATSRNSVQERKRVVEEAKLEMQALQERQELQRKLEEVDKGRAELSRKLELLNARTKVKRAEIDLVVEQNVEGEMKDGMNEYLKQHHAQNHLSNEALLLSSMNGATSTSKSQPISSKKEMSTPLAELNFAQSQLSVSSAQSSVETEPVVDLSSMPCVVSAVTCSSKASSEKVSAMTLPHSVDCERIASSAAHLSHPKTTLVYTTGSVPVYTLAGLSPIRNQSTPKTST